MNIGGFLQQKAPSLLIGVKVLSKVHPCYLNCFRFFSRAQTGHQ